MQTLCFGEALVDLIRRSATSRAADRLEFVPALGGVSANVAVTAARHGAQIAFAGGAGDDRWGAWVRDALAAEGLDLRWFALVAGRVTGLALTTVDERGEPRYELYGDGPAALVDAVEGRLTAAVEATDAFFFTSNTLAGAAEARLTHAARERALQLGRPVVLDVSLRPHRWEGGAARAAAAARTSARGAFLVKCNDEEARALTGARDAEAAARELLALGARHVVVTRGADGAILRGHGVRGDVDALPARVRSTAGAGDAFAGVLLARLAQAQFQPAALQAALGDAAAAAARACEQLGALA